LVQMGLQRATRDIFAFYASYGQCQTFKAFPGRTLRGHAAHEDRNSSASSTAGARSMILSLNPGVWERSAAVDLFEMLKFSQKSSIWVRVSEPTKSPMWVGWPWPGSRTLMSALTLMGLIPPGEGEASLPSPDTVCLWILRRWFEASR
jgi:hypothetical protein